MHKALAVLFALALLPASARATAQTPDVLLYDNKVYDLFSNPLETFYADERPRPRFQIRPGTFSSGNWRGYVAFWEVAGDALFLRGVDSWLCQPPTGEECKRADLAELFGERSREGRVAADWFSGELRMPEGKQLQYVHMGYGSVYEKEIVLVVAAGKVTGRRVVDNTKRALPSQLELQRQELEKMKGPPAGKRKARP